jgi:hypothetical protein
MQQLRRGSRIVSAGDSRGVSKQIKIRANIHRDPELITSPCLAGQSCDEMYKFRNISSNTILFRINRKHSQPCYEDKKQEVVERTNATNFLTLFNTAVTVNLRFWRNHYFNVIT